MTEIAHEASEEFMKKVKDLLESITRQPYGITEKQYLQDTNVIWSVYLDRSKINYEDWLSINKGAYFIQGEKDGAIRVYSWHFYNVDDVVLKTYGLNLSIRHDLLERKNWEKYRGRVPGLIAELETAERIANEANREHGTDIKLWAGERPMLLTGFNSKGMSEDEGLHEIERHARVMLDVWKAWWEWANTIGTEIYLKTTKIKVGKIELIDYAVVMSEVAKELRGVTGAPYILEREAVILDHKHLDQLAMIEAMRNLKRKREVALANLWGDKQRAISGVWYEANTQLDDDPPGVILMSTGHLLLERYRGIFDEALSKPKGELHEEIIEAATRIAEEITKRMGVPVYLRTKAMMDLLERDGEIYGVELYEFNSDFSIHKIADARGIIDETIRRAEVLREAYFRWMTARKSILEKHGIDATALYVRDLLEAVQRLPPWSCLVTPTDEGYIAEVDDDYARIASGELNRQIREIRIRRQGEEMEVEIRTDYIPVEQKARKHHIIIYELPERGDEEMATFLTPKNLQFINQHAPSLGRVLDRMTKILDEASVKIGTIKCVDDYDHHYTFLKLRIKLRQEELALKLGDILRALISTYTRLDRLLFVINFEL